MSKGDESAYPVLMLDTETNTRVYAGGLTKREYFAGLAMQGVLSNQQTMIGVRSLARDEKLSSDIVVANVSVENADALLKELEGSAE